MATRTAVAALPASLADARRLRVAALWGLLAAKMLGGWGVQWDIRWHLLIGRDSFWIPPHVMTYLGVTIGALLAFGVLAHDTWRARRGQPPRDGLPAFGLTGTPGFHLAWWGMALTILAAPIDDLWHRLFGIDVTLWSPPHLLGLAGAQVNTLGCLLIALELWPPFTRAGRRALLAGGMLLLAAFYVTVDPSIQTAFRRGGVFFFTWAILGASAFTFAHVLTARLTAWRSAPLVLALGALAMHLAGTGLGTAGFALAQPTPAVEEAIAADPTSPIAVAWEMARLNGASAPGRSAALRWLPVLPAALLVLVDVRRRWAATALAHALALVAVSGLLFARLPALAHALPAPVDVALALALAALAGLAGGAAAVAVAGLFHPVRHPAPV